jgi:hypothetical protein
VEGREKPHADKYKEIVNDWGYNTSCMHISLPIFGLRKFQVLDFCGTGCAIVVQVCSGPFK